MLFDKSAILTVQNHVITRNPRISVSHDKHRTWFLHINDVHEEDKGKYMCQINTAAAKTQYGYLHVVGKALLTQHIDFRIHLNLFFDIVSASLLLYLFLFTMLNVLRFVDQSFFFQDNIGNYCLE